MTEAEPQFLRVGSGVSERRIAYIADSSGISPGVMWLSGLKSEMISTKASVLAEWATERGHPCTRFDYSGHGQSAGRFEDGTVGAWLEEAVAVFREITRGPQVLVGSSMGGYIALLLLRTLMDDHPAEAARVKALLLIAPAWDMTERLMWRRLPENARADIMAKGVYMRPSKYGDGDYAITRHMIEDGRTHLIGDAPFDPGRPIHVLHGKLDPDVPWEHTRDLMALLPGNRVTMTWVPDGEHRLSRPEDLALMTGALDDLARAS
jgi:pimeloyl-ACP methyl ester carboxylesterase